MQVTRLGRGRLFDVAVFVMGTVVSLGFALPWFLHPSHIAIANIVVPISVVLLAQFPLELPSRAGDVVIGFEAAALVYLALVCDRSLAIGLWLLAMVLAHGVGQRKEWNVRLFNIGCTSLSGVVLTLCVSAGHLAGGWVELVMIAFGCAAYFVLDLVITALSLAVLEQTSIKDALPLRTAALPLVVFVGIDTLGYLAALLYWAYPPWALLLLVVPVVTILVAARAVTRARDSERRSAGLFTIAHAATQLEGVRDVAELLVDQLQELMPNRSVQIRATAAAQDEIGAALTSAGHEGRHVVVSRGRGDARFRDVEVQTLDTLVAVAGETLERQRLVAEMTRMARFDPLTGLANRALFGDRLSHALNLSRRGHGTVAVLYCDLDGFKGVNDRFGHDVGDQVLGEVGRRLTTVLRATDTAARLGGDEFAVLAEDLLDGEEAITVGRRIVAAMAEPIVLRDLSLQMGISVGIAVSTGDLMPDELLRNADMTMYRAKAFGKNRVEFFDPEMRRASEQRMRLEDELWLALENESLTLHLQPVVDLSSGRIDGFEALLRWIHPALGTIPPDVFLPVAEQLGVMKQLGRWVLHRAHGMGLELAEAAGRQITMAVNVAAEQLHDEQFLVEAARLAPDPRVHLVLELTEGALVDDQIADLALRRLHDAGAGIAIDDFGVGYSSIGYLHRYECIDIVKIDRSFVRTVAADERTLALVESIVAMANAFEAVVVAEGIEDWQACAALNVAGCDLGQGFRFSPAVPVERARELLLATTFDLTPAGIGRPVPPTPTVAPV
ncbi:MAG TPA: EAL domain-containing protein [Mycobacteriales bacterium]|nr:EAL domain-containing protein [Mycobacteriales bacterium]